MKRYVIAVMVLLLAPVAMPAADIDDLKAAVEKIVNLNASLDMGDVDGMAALFHKEAIGFGREVPFAEDLKGSDPKEFVKQFKQTQNEQFESYRITLVNPEYRIIGDTGIVTTHARVDMKPKDAPHEAIYNRITLVYTKTGGKWHIAAWHISAIPWARPPAGA